MASDKLLSEMRSAASRINFKIPQQHEKDYLIFLSQSNAGIEKLMAQPGMSCPTNLYHLLIPHNNMSSISMSFDDNVQ